MKLIVFFDGLFKLKLILFHSGLFVFLGRIFEENFVEFFCLLLCAEIAVLKLGFLLESLPLIHGVADFHFKRLLKTLILKEFIVKSLKCASFIKYCRKIYKMTLLTLKLSFLRFRTSSKSISISLFC